MTNLEETLLHLVTPLVSDKDNLHVKEMSSLSEDETLLHVYANKEDLSVLIGKQGATANALRQLLQTTHKITDKKILIKFEEI